MTDYSIQAIQVLTEDQRVKVSNHYGGYKSQYPYLIGTVFTENSIWKIKGLTFPGDDIEQLRITDLQCWEKFMPLKEIIYTKHLAGSFEDGIQICTLCLQVLSDYSGGGWMSPDGWAPSGFPQGPVYRTGINPIQTQIDPPLENYAPEDPYSRKIIKCIL